MATRTRTGTDAHEKAVQQGFADIVRVLQENIGPNLTAYIAGKSTQTVNRWAKEDQSPPGDDIEKRMRAAYQIYRTITEVNSNHVARAWFMGMNPQLEDMSPAEVLLDDRLRDAMSAARAFRSGG